MTAAHPAPGGLAVQGQEARAAFTPGPWELRANYGNLRSEIYAGGRAIATVWTKQASTREEQKEPVPWPEGEANAALLLAAPDLLKAAKRALATLRASGYHDEPNNVLGALYAAISRATGN
jgi:hypothetical protein